MEIRFSSDDVNRILIEYVKTNVPALADKWLEAREAGAYSWERRICVVEVEPPVELKEVA